MSKKHNKDCICEGRDSDIHDRETLGRLEVFASSLMEETESESRVWDAYKARRVEAMRRSGFDRVEE